MQFYTDPTRESDPFALPNAETFHNNINGSEYWYWWSCFPGCLPDSDPVGPFDTEQAAIDDAQDY